MIPARDSLWNIPEWAVVLMYSSQAIGFGILAARVYLRSRLWLKGKGKLPLDNLWGRTVRLLKYGIGQAKIVRETFAGTMHLSFFWAFVILFIGTTLALIDQDIFEFMFNAKLLKGTGYLIYETVLDLFTIVGIVGLAMAIGRRAFRKPAKLTHNPGFTIMLWMFLIFFINGLAIESIRLTVADPAWGAWSFVGFGISRAILALNISDASLQAWHLALWVFHVVSVATFYAVFVDMPTKHILYSPANIFFSSFRPAGALAALDLEDETIETFGVSQIVDLSFMQLLDGDACTECGRCQAVCPAYIAGTPLNPKQIVLDIRKGLDTYGPQMIALTGDTAEVSGMALTGEITSTDALWACTTCRACVYECPVLIEHVDSIVDMRRYLTLMEGDVPDLLANAMTQAERAGNPWGNPKGSRMDWAAGLNVPLLSEKKQADVLYWIGCAGSYDPESQKTSRAMVQILEAAGIDYAVLGEEERCNCEWARRAGNEYLFQEASNSNIAIFDKYEFKTIITHCPHCFNTFKNEYPQFGGDYDVVHHTTYITELIDKGFLKVSGTVRDQITYHDSCYLGRYNEVYDAPRDVLGSAGVSVMEMDRSRGKGLCCGGGGAQVWFETHQEIPVNEIRLAEAMDTGADTVGTACPFCTIMLSSAAQSKGVAEQVAIKDVAVIVAEAVATS